LDISKFPKIKFSRSQESKSQGFKVIHLGFLGLEVSKFIRIEFSSRYQGFQNADFRGLRFKISVFEDFWKQCFKVRTFLRHFKNINFKISRFEGFKIARFQGFKVSNSRSQLFKPINSGFQDLDVFKFLRINFSSRYHVRGLEYKISVFEVFWNLCFKVWRFLSFQE
jgi:hypothetical protein